MTTSIPLAAEPGTAKGVEGVILTGGKSRRMGRDKKALQLGNGTVFGRILHAMKPLVTEVRAVGSQRPQALDGDAATIGWQPDLRAASGPLTGIHTALVTSKVHRVLIVACDLPFVTTAFLRLLVDDGSPHADVVLPRRDGRALPVCAVYDVSCRQRLERYLDAGHFAARGFVASVSARYIDEASWAAVDPEGRSFFNLNTPEDYDRAKRLAVAEPVSDER